MAHAASTGRPSIAPSMFSSVACARSWATTQNTRASFVPYAERDTSLLEATVPERAQRVSISIFARLLTIMIIMAVTLLLIVGFFFVFVVFPGATAEAGHAFEQYSEGIAATSPDLQTAMALAHRLSVQIRYEGPRGSWTTADYLPGIVEAREGKIYAPIGHNYYLEPSADGGTYLFAWDFSEHVRNLHAKMLWLLLFLVTGVVCTAYFFQKRLLRPVRLLDDGVGRLSKGDLNVAVPGVT